MDFSSPAAHFRLQGSSVARRQNLIPSFLGLRQGWRAGAQLKERKGSNFAAQLSGAIVLQARKARHLQNKTLAIAIWPPCRKDCDFNFSPTVGSWIASVFPLGCVTSILLGGYLMDRVGRKRAMMLMTLPFVLGWLLLLLPVPLGLGEDSAVILLIAGRYLTGGPFFLQLSRKVLLEVFLTLPADGRLMLQQKLIAKPCNFADELHCTLRNIFISKRLSEKRAGSNKEPAGGIHATS